ncbi:endolytic transglycosylase MltG [bacterium]|jgi:UPF0755 protein|nr:endolytic transglycosylase MltG [bacterium]
MKKAFLLLMIGFMGLGTFVSAAETVDVTIPNGASLDRIIQVLSDDGIIANQFFFKVYVKTKKLGNKFRAGTFLLSPDYSYARISNILQEKEGAASLTKVTIPEGYTLKEIAETLEKKGVIPNAKAFRDYVNRKGKSELQSEFEFLNHVPTRKLEGYLFPETYLFAKNGSHKSILRGFLSQFETTLFPLWNASDKKMSLHKTATMASIIEKESYGTDEMKKISGVFHSRLKKRMLLASCPTVSYALGKPRKRFLFYSDLEVKSPYNTYRRHGLPPTPIAAPGVQAFLAALYPNKTPYLYFVANGDGSHQFSKTLREHLNRQKRILATQKHGKGIAF